MKMLRIKLIIVTFQLSLLTIHCEEPLLAVSGGGIGIEGYVCSKTDSLPLDSVQILLTSFEGTNLKRDFSDVVFLSDSLGRFSCRTGVGYSIQGNDTIDLVHSCRAILSKIGFKDTSIDVNDKDDYYDLQIYLHP